jgi:hypothetical protein
MGNPPFQKVYFLGGITMDLVVQSDYCKIERISLALSKVEILIIIIILLTLVSIISKKDYDLRIIISSSRFS